MNQFFVRGVRAAVVSVSLATLLASTTALPLAVPAQSAEYKVVVKVKKSGFRTVRMIGKSPYICTPSGFGQKGRCYLRNAA